jgi:PTH2 family peptidyl-tRNA hydrolase
MVKQVIVLRTDCNMRKGKMAAQAAHASMKVFIDRGILYDSGIPVAPYHNHELAVPLWPEAVEWLRGAFTKIVLGVDSEQGLRDLETAAKSAGLPCAIIVDNGATEFHGVQTPTALAIGPAEASKIDAITKHLKLL